MSDPGDILSRAFSWLKSVPALLRPRWGGRRAIDAFQNAGAAGHWANTWTDSRYEQVRHFKHWVYVAVDRVATAVAMSSPNVSFLRDRAKRPGGGKGKWLPPATRAKALTPLQSHEELEPAPDFHPLCRLLSDPNEPDTAYDLWYETVMYLLLTGNAYWWLPPSPSLGVPAAAWVLPSHWVSAHVGNDGGVDAYELRPVEGNYVRAAIPARDVVHFRRKSPISKQDGYSPLTASAQWVDTQESIDRTRWWSFRNGIFPSVSIEFDAGVKLPDDSDLNRIEARILSRYGGEHNANRPMFVPPGAKLKPLQVSPRELMFCESTEQMRDQILATFGVPATIAQVNGQMTYGSIVAAQAGFCMLTLNPLYRYLGQVLTEKLAQPRFDRGLRVWWEDKTPQDPELLEKQLATDLAYGARTMNEVRAIRGQEPFPQPWASEPWLPMNTLPASRLLRGRDDDDDDNDDDGKGKGAPGGNRATQSDSQSISNGPEQSVHE